MTTLSFPYGTLPIERSTSVRRRPAFSKAPLTWLAMMALLLVSVAGIALVRATSAPNRMATVGAAHPAVPAGLAAEIQRALGGSSSGVFNAPATPGLAAATTGWSATALGGSLSAMIGTSGALALGLQSSGLAAHFSAQSLAFGSGAPVALPAASAGTLVGDRLVQTMGSVNTWYLTTTAGIEQGFLVNRVAGAGAGPLHLSLGSGLGWKVAEAGSALVTKTTHGSEALVYGGLRVVDSNGAVIGSHFAIVHGVAQIVADVTKATAFPLKIDPTFTTTSTPSATLVTAAGSDFGDSVSLSSDGTTAVVGALSGDSGYGAAFVFHTSSEGSWAASTTTIAALTYFQATSDDQFGNSVAISSDGDTVAVGAFDYNTAHGAVFIYRASSEGAWTSSTMPQAMLTASASPPNGNFGQSVSLSADGSTALVGGVLGTNGNKGAAYVFHVSSATAWASTSTPTATLTSSTSVSGDNFGESVSLSADGSTALIGTYVATSGKGLAYVFHTASAAAWATTATPNAILSDAADNNGDEFGLDVVLSTDGATAAIGAPGENTGSGAVYIFHVASEGTWSTTSTPGATLSVAGGGTNVGFGSGIALSGAGTIALIGDPGVNLSTGAAYIYEAASEAAWTSSSTPIAALSTTNGTAFDGFGDSSAVALSGDGSTAIVGAPGINKFAGAAFVFTASSTPSHGYWLVGSDGGIFSFGSAQFHGSTGSLVLQRPVVGIAPTPDRNGYWLVGSDGGVFSFGDTQFYGSLPLLGYAPAGTKSPKRLAAPIVAMVPSTDDRGYFMVGSDGGVFAFGDAKFAGSCPAIGGCSGAAESVMPDASGQGYWLVTKTGHVYSFGDAVYYGAPGPQSAPVTSAVRTPDGGGYWVLLGNGTVFAYGDAKLYTGSAGSFSALNPATAIVATSDGGGYWIASANGTIYTYGDAPYEGDLAGKQLNGPIIAASGS